MHTFYIIIIYKNAHTLYVCVIAYMMVVGGGGYVCMILGAVHIILCSDACYV